MDRNKRPVRPSVCSYEYVSMSVCLVRSTKPDSKRKGAPKMGVNVPWGGVVAAPIFSSKGLGLGLRNAVNK